MAIYIYNSLSRRKEEFKSIKKNNVKMYVCGPTVYDESHIGHARGAFVFDVIKNYFRYKGFKVKYVRNVTDIDDKIIDKARSIAGEVKDLKKTVSEVADKYSKKYNKDMKALGIGSPDVEPKATEHIRDMINIIRALLKRGYAYEAGGDIYFRVRNFNSYGKLSHQSIKMMEAGARVAPGECKEDPLDFALWKKSKEAEPGWKNGNIEGRPGWHIECSAMSMKHLGENFDIHGGGIDLIFPHHENEIAQSESYSGKRFANYWMHNGLLTINGQKMAKSLGNYLSISEFLDRYDADILKLFFLSAHYRSPVDFTEANIMQAKEAREKFMIFFDRAEEYISKTPAGRLNGRARRNMAESILKKPDGYINDSHRHGLANIPNVVTKKDFDEAMDDDFNTPQALSVLFLTVGFANGVMNAPPTYEGASLLLTIVHQIRRLGGIMGLTFLQESVSNEVKEMIEGKLKMREGARRDKDYELADRIRKELSEQGVILEDTKDGTKWRLR